MKVIICFILAFLCSLVLPHPTQAQYTGVLEAHYQGLAYPERFDQFVANNRSLFDGQFFSCLRSLEQVWRRQAEEETEICNGHVNPEWRAKCFKDAQFIGMADWSASIRSVLNGQARWTDTRHGAAALLLKNMSQNMLGPGVYAQVVAKVFQGPVRIYFLCQ